MKSLYDVLGVRADDNPEAIKRAFRTAVKAHHPDLHPGDPDAVLRFRRIVTANVILSDEKQRAAYDLMLARNRRQTKMRGDRELLRLQYRRRKTRLKVGATAAVVLVCALAGGFMVMPKTTIVELMGRNPPTAKTAVIVETPRKDKAATAAIAASAAARTSEDASTTAAGRAADVSRGTGDLPAPNEELGRTPAGGGEAFGGDIAVLTGHELQPLPKDAHFYRELGIVSYRIGDFPRAIVSLGEAIRLDPDSAKAYNIRGNSWDEIGAPGKALADYDAAIRIDPNNPILFHDRAVMWHRKGDLDKALGDLDRAIRSNSSDPNIYCDRGLVWYEKGNRARAIADFNHAIGLDPDFAAACISRGLLLHRGGEFNLALGDIEKTIVVSPAVFDISRRVASHP